MISYAPLRETMKAKGITTYTLIHQFKISSSTIHRFRHDMPVSTLIINDLCNILKCSVEDIMIHIPDSEEYMNQRMKKWEKD